MAEDDSVEGVEPQDKQDWACYLAPFILTLLVLLGTVYRTRNKQVVDTTKVHTANDKRVVNTAKLRTSANEKRAVSTKTVRTSNEKRDVSTKMVRTSDKKRAIVGTKSGPNQDYHRRILKTHSRSEYNSTSEEIVDEKREGFESAITERHEKSIGYASPTIWIPPKVPRVLIIAPASGRYNTRSSLSWNWYYGGCFG